MDVIGDVFATSGDAAGCGDAAIEVEGVVGGAAADIDEQGSAFAFGTIEGELSGGDGREDYVIDVHLEFADAFDAILNARANACDNVKIGL